LPAAGQAFETATAAADQANVAGQSHLGAPRIVLELRMLGINVAKSTVEVYKPKPSKPTSPTWKTFLKQRADELVSIDFFVVPTVTFKVLFVFVVLSHDRRRIVHFNVTEHPTAQWTAQQLTEASPFDTAPRYLIREGDGSYGHRVRRRIRSLGIGEIVTAPASPWQNPFVERVIGSIRRELLDHVVILSERHLKRLLSNYLDYYRSWRTHQSLAGDTPDHRPVRSASLRQVAEFPTLHGLHHYYLPKAA
jgi:putative transposase